LCDSQDTPYDERPRLRSSHGLEGIIAELVKQISQRSNAAGLAHRRADRLRLGVRGVVDVCQNVSRWDVENARAAPSLE
jgi:hypothetical protein